MVSGFLCYEVDEFDFRVFSNFNMWDLSVCEEGRFYFVCFLCASGCGPLDGASQLGSYYVIHVLNHRLNLARPQRHFVLSHTQPFNGA